MPHQCSTTRSSRSSARFPPYSCPALPPSGRPSGPPSETYLSPASAYHIHPSASIYPTINSVAVDPPVRSFSATRPVNNVQLSTSNLQLEYSRHQSYGRFDAQSNRPTPLPSQRTLGPYHPHPAADDPYPNPARLHPQPSAQSICREQPSVTSHQPEDLIYRNDLVHQLSSQLPSGSASTRQGPTYFGEGIFSKSQNFSVKDSTFINNSPTSDNFMKDFLQHTIIGAEYDSSDRNPPPRCHPGTRLAIIERCKVFIVLRNSAEKMRWVVGPAGVGKSAIMQIVAEETPADASVFFSVNGRRDGTKTFTTIAYQLAAKYEPYRQFISKEISRDPTLLRKALSVQFRKFIIDPFIHQRLFSPSDRFVVIIDGLDECDDPFTQRELLELISNFCLSYPTSPIAWFIASRPEPHITSFFNDARVAPAYIKEEIMIDSDEACEDVQWYLRDELNKTKRVYPTLKRKREWPSEFEFTKIATAAGGLFAYASTVVRYIGDPHYGDPASQLSDVLVVINTGPQDDTLRRNNPLALLDALYERIISKIPDGSMINTRKLLLVHSNYETWSQDEFRSQCNRLGLTEDAAYGAVRHLHAVMKVPAPDEADDKNLTYFHKSFGDFLLDFKRSQFSRDVRSEVELLQAQCSLRIVEQAPDNFDGVAANESVRCGAYGYLKAGSGFYDNISLSWPDDECFQITDYDLRRHLYTISMDDLCRNFHMHSDSFATISCFHALTTRFATLNHYFPIRFVRDSMFGKFRPELVDLGKLKRVPLRALDLAAICGWFQLQFMSPAGIDINYSDPWDPICKHFKAAKEDTDGQQLRRGWTTAFERSLDNPEGTVSHTDISRFNIKVGKGYHWKTVSGGLYQCLHCLQRFARHCINNPDQLATIFVDSTGMCYVELLFVDPDDGVSEWRYRFFHSGLPSCM